MATIENNDNFPDGRLVRQSHHIPHRDALVVSRGILGDEETAEIMRSIRVTLECGRPHSNTREWFSTTTFLLSDEKIANGDHITTQATDGRCRGAAPTPYIHSVEFPCPSPRPRA